MQSFIRSFLKRSRLGIILVIIAALATMRGMAQATKLKVVPEVQSFTLSTGNYAMGTKVSILVESAHSDSLMSIAQQLKDELNVMFKVTATVTETTSTSASTGEVLLMYSGTKLTNSEAYKMTVAGGITIAGATRQGTFWGTRTLLQLIENHKNLIPCGVISDYPNYPNRGFMLDCGRKFFTIDFLRHYVKMMSYYKMNEFQVHLNDNGFKGYFGNDWTKTYAAFRLESESFPGLAAKDGHYSKVEFRDLQLLGMQYGVNVIPEIDVPAHALAFTQYMPALALNKDTMDHISLLPKDTAVVFGFVDKLLSEYTTGPNPCFVGPDLHFGTDEYSVKYAAQFYSFTKRYLHYVESLGYRGRLWGGLRWMQSSLNAQGITARITDTKGAIMNAWSYDWVDPNQQLKDGFKLITTCDSWLYIVPAAGYYREFLDYEWLYTTFRPEKVNANETLTPNFKPGLLGAMFAVWNDICGNGISQQDVHYRAYNAFKVLGNKLWKVVPVRTYAAYKAVADSTSEGPGLNYSGVYSPDSLAAISAKIGAEPVNFDGKTKVSLGGTDFGYDYDVSFDIKPEVLNGNNAVVFQSQFSKVTLNTNGTGKLGFSRDGYSYTFNYTPKSDWQRVRILGDYKTVTLYVDSVRIERLVAYSKTGFSYQQTLFFPLEVAGDSENGFKGQLRNLQLQKLDLAKIKADFMLTKVALTPGLYYIKQGDKYLTNPGASGGNPTFLAKYTTTTTIPQQQWNVTLDATTSRYKIVSAKDSRYINELGAFGTNAYYATWNSYTVYKNDSLYAIQNGGDAGVGFWYAANNRLNKGDETYDDSNYSVKFVPVSTTFIDKLLDSAVKIFQKKNSIEVRGVKVKELSLLGLNGSTIITCKSTNTLMVSPSLSGYYLLNVTTDNDKSGTYKVKL